MSTSASENSRNESNTVPRPNPDVTNGATFHSCEHCRDFTLDFGLSIEEMEEIIVARTGKSLKELESIKRFPLNLKQLRENKEKAAILSVTGAQIHQKAYEGCKFYAHILGKNIVPKDDSIDVIFAVFNDFRLVLSFGRLVSLSASPPLSLFVPNDNPLAECILGRPLPVDPWSESTREQVRQWMRICDSPHDIRQPEEDCFSPTHLIELSPCSPECSSECSSECCGFTLRLKKNIQGPVSYAALSYCWGGNQRLKATKSNIHELLNSIPYAEMPATLQDAAKVAFDLNFRFIWIDALCLIQDLDINEVHTLIAEIPNIYRYATLTIAAQSSHTAGEGFLHPRDIRKSMGSRFDDLCEYQIAIKNLGGKSGFAMLSLYHAYDRKPINNRAWTLQEQLLSQRYLTFSNITTEWQSYKNGFKDECGADENLSSGRSVSSPLDYDKLIYDWNILNSSQDLNTHKRHDVWIELVFQYTCRSLSNPEDRPIAISALANVFGDAQDYIAGLWLSKLCYGLCWRHVPPSDKILSGYYAPSWSWWSVQGVVDWNFRINKMHQEPEFRLVEYESKLAHLSAPFGYLVDASLRVEARCGKVFVSAHELGEHRSDERIKLKYGTFGSVEWSGNDYRNSNNILWDRRGMCFKGQILRILVLFVSSKRHIGVFGLLLTDDKSGENEHGNRCRRVGTLHVTNFGEDKEMANFIDWLKEQPVETLTLV